jgi:2-haloacid dehalogenase
MTQPVSVEAVLFDVFGTVVDWRSAVIAEGERLGAGREVDWAAVADSWRRDGYLRPIRAMVSGTRDREPVEAVMRAELDRLADRHGFSDLGAEALDDLAGVWERLRPWPDVAAGLERLRARYVIGPLSNGGFGALTRMARYNGLRWDCVVSAEIFNTYKPDPAVYHGAAALLGLAPDRLMLVAAHPSDLRAARACGLATGYVPRPLEWGPAGPEEVAGEDEFDVFGADFEALADRLGCRD